MQRSIGMWREQYFHKRDANAPIITLYTTPRKAACQTPALMATV